MKFPWQKALPLAEKTTVPSTASPLDRSIELQEPQDEETRIIPVPEDEQPNSLSSSDRPEATEQVVTDSDPSRTAEEIEAETDLAPTASGATEASSVGEAGEDDESKYPKALPLAILTFGLCMSTFVVALDNTIIGELYNVGLFPSSTERWQQLLYRGSRQFSIL